jgi:tetratricopeptide (TPR) repeat protein
MITARQIDMQQNSAIARTVFVLTVCFAVGFFSYCVARIAWAAEQVESRDRSRIPMALAADESNPSLHNWAGILYLDGDQLQSERAVQEFRRAAALNPRVADYWANLGRACFITNDPGCAEGAYERSVVAAPLNPRFLNELAMYYLATGNMQKALRGVHRLLEIEPATANSALSLCLRAVSPELLWSAVVHDQTKVAVRMEFFQILSERGMGDSAERYWAEFAASRPTLSLEDAEPYLNFLESKRNYSVLIQVWQDLENLHAKGIPSRAEGNLVVNPGFEQTPTNLGLDWHLRPEQFLDTQIAASERGNALQLEFTVPHNAEHEPAYQIVPVSPGKTYQLRGRARSQEITSDSGPRLRIVDPACSDCVNASSDGATGTTEWHDISATFTAGPATQLVRLSVWRPRSRSFPTEISGRFWLDDVSLRSLY